MLSRGFSCVALAAVLSAALRCAGAETARADLVDAKGSRVGAARLTQTPHGVLLRVRLSGLPPGAHALHLHQTGKCEPPFTTAGDHFNPGGRKHGLSNPDGMHAGDLPNIHVGRDGEAVVEVLAAQVTLSPGPTSLLDADGTSLVLHAGPDDYASDPAGKAGDRIACGVIKK